MTCTTLMLLAACSNQHGNTPAPPASTSPAPVATTNPHSSQFVSQHWGVAIGYPPDWKLQHDFRHSYLQAGTWKTYAGPNSHGTPVVALTMPGSNRITDAEVRIGVSTAKAEVAQCLKPSQAVHTGSVGKVTINGIRFTHFDAGDAAMSHYLDVHSYRTVHDGSCYAIDLLVYGSNPQVYSPPATPPFTRKQAFAEMQQVLQGFRFLQ